MIIKYALLIVLLLTAGISLADSPPPIPNTFSGTLRFSNSSGQFDAPAGTLIEAYIDSIAKGNTTVGMAGGYIIDVYGTNDDDIKTITFIVKGTVAEQNAVFNTSSPPPKILDLVVNISDADTLPPASVTNLRNLSYAPDYINWTWNDPADMDFSGVLVYLDGTYKVTVPKGVRFYNAVGFATDTPHSIATRTIDMVGNVNNTWVNHTARTAPVPSSLSIVINNGQTYTNSTSVTLGLSAVNAEQMSFSNDSITWSPLETYATSKSWTLTIGDGIKKVYFRARNFAGEASPVNNTIILDTAPPSVVITSPANGTIYNSSNVAVIGSATDSSCLTVGCFEQSGGGGASAGCGGLSGNTSVSFMYNITLQEGRNFIRIAYTDSANNTGSASVNLTLDTIPPASIKNLVNVSYAGTYINWTWIDPADSDFDHIEVYLDGIQKPNVSPGVQYYNATGLTESSTHEISTRTVDNLGNVNATWKNHTAWTAKALESVMNVNIDILKDKLNPGSDEAIWVAILSNATFNATIEVNASSVEFGPSQATMDPPYEKDNDVNHDGYNDLLLKFKMKDTGIKCGDTQAKLIGKTYSGLNISGTDSFETIACGGGNGGGGSSGGGGVVTSEPFDNIAKAERYDKSLIVNSSVTYKFTAPEHGIYEIAITGRENENDISLRVEALKGRSKLVSVDAPGTIYKNLNIWAGTKRIKDAMVRFKVENSWIESNNQASSDVRMLKWDGSKWVQLETREISIDAFYRYYEAKTDTFSNFAIIGMEGAAIPTITPTGTAPRITLTATDTPGITEKAPVNLTAIIVVLVLIGIIAVLYLRRKQKDGL